MVCMLLDKINFSNEIRVDVFQTTPCSSKSHPALPVNAMLCFARAVMKVRISVNFAKAAEDG